MGVKGYVLIRGWLKLRKLKHSVSKTKTSNFDWTHETSLFEGQPFG
jgi:hypothetical protein